jgi:glycosyltransferase involved in cell wall biosynthesis
VADASDRSVAVAHGNYMELGGAELVSHELARTFDAEMFYGFGEAEYVPDDIDAQSLFEDSPLRFLRETVPTRDLYYAWNAQRIPALRAFDVVLLSKNELAWYVPEDEQTVVHYVHSTPRTPYDLFQSRADSPVSRLYSWVARSLYLPNTKFPDLFVANSELVARRIERYWRVPEERVAVVYPPVDVAQYAQRERANYYLTYSRLIPEKRIDRIVRAFDGLDERLVVGGAGAERDRLERLAPPNVEFVGYMSESEKRRRLGEAKALLFNAENEDFGLIPVEAFAAGTPVLGVDEGYTKYQIQDGENGYTHAPDPASIRESVERFEADGVAWSRDRIEQYAERYGLGRFREEMRTAVDAATDARVEVASRASEGDHSHGGGQQ